MDKNEETFKPLGAITFFVLLLVLALIIWFGMYFLMISQAQ